MHMLLARAGPRQRRSLGLQAGACAASRETAFASVPIGLSRLKGLVRGEGAKPYPRCPSRSYASAHVTLVQAFTDRLIRILKDTEKALRHYESSDRIELYPQVITAAAEVLELSPRYLKSVVFIHLSAWH